jgi:hypothetical protein
MMVLTFIIQVYIPYVEIVTRARTKNQITKLRRRLRTYIVDNNKTLVTTYSIALQAKFS